MTTFINDNKNTTNISEQELKEQESFRKYIIKKQKIALLSKIQGLEIQMDLVSRPNDLNIRGFDYFNSVAQKHIQDTVIKELKKEIFELLEKIDLLT